MVSPRQVVYSVQTKIKPDPIDTYEKIEPEMNKDTTHLKSTKKLISCMYTK